MPTTATPTTYHLIEVFTGSLASNLERLAKEGATIISVAPTEFHSVFSQPGSAHMEVDRWTIVYSQPAR